MESDFSIAIAGFGEYIARLTARVASLENELSSIRGVLAKYDKHLTKTIDGMIQHLRDQDTLILEAREKLGLDSITLEECHLETVMPQEPEDIRPDPFAEARRRMEAKALVE